MTIVATVVGIIVVLVQAANYVIVMQMRSEVAGLKVYMHEKFVTQTVAATTAAQVQDSTKRMIEIALQESRNRWEWERDR